MAGAGEPLLWADVIHTGTGVTVRLSGEFDITSAPAAQRVIEHLRPATQIVLDLSRITFFDAGGVQFLITLRERAAAAGTGLVIRNPSWAVRHLLELTGTEQLILSGQRPATSPVGDPDVAAVCGEVLASAIRFTGSGMGTMQVVEPESGAMRIVAQQGFSAAFLDYFSTVLHGEAACGTALASGEPVWVDNVTRSAVFTGTPAMDVVLGAGVQAVASVPVQGRDGKVIAMLSTHRRRLGEWDSGCRLQLHALASAAGRLLGW